MLFLYVPVHEIMIEPSALHSIHCCENLLFKFEVNRIGLLSRNPRFGGNSRHLGEVGGVGLCSQWDKGAESLVRSLEAKAPRISKPFVA